MLIQNRKGRLIGEIIEDISVCTLKDLSNVFKLDFGSLTMEPITDLTKLDFENDIFIKRMPTREVKNTNEYTGSRVLTKILYKTNGVSEDGTRVTFANDGKIRFIFETEEKARNAWDDVVSLMKSGVDDTGCISVVDLYEYFGIPYEKFEGMKKVGWRKKRPDQTIIEIVSEPRKTNHDETFGWTIKRPYDI